MTTTQVTVALAVSLLASLLAPPVRAALKTLWSQLMQARTRIDWKSQIAYFLTTTVAVFAALIADGCRQDRALQELADRTRLAVATELEANMNEFAASAESLNSLTVKFRDVVRQQAEVEDLTIIFPDVSTTAWRAAQTMVPAAYLDSDWLLQVSQVYELYEEYVHSRRDFYDDFILVSSRLSNSGVLQGEPEELAEFGAPIYGHLVLLNDLHGQVHNGFLGALQTIR